MGKQINMRLIDTESGQLLIKKGFEDDDLVVRFSMIHEVDDDMYFTPSVIMSFKNKEDQQKAFDTDDFENLAKGLFSAIAEYI